MCGIVVLAGAGATRPAIVEAGVSALEHRGPDGRGTWRSRDGQVAFGHARLAILDLSEAGAQPMVSHDGAAAVTFNGEIYNYREIKGLVRTELRSTSDTEVLLELVRARGARALDLFRGMFAFAYWDGDELLVVRDRLGIKPLFWAETPGGIAAASEIGALLAMGAGERRVDRAAIDEYMTYLYVPPPRTALVGVHELPPGHLLRWRPGRAPVVERWWALEGRTPSHVPEGEEVRALLDESVRLHLIADVPVGVFLSGGLDSSTITALASRHHAGRLRTITVTFGDEGSYLDERAFAREVAARFGTEHVEIQAEANVATILPALVRHFGQPFGNPTSVLAYELSRATREHVKVALAGDGGDEVLGGYPRYQGVRVAQTFRRLPAALRQPLAQAMLDVAAGGSRGKLGSRVRRFAESIEGDPDRMYFKWASYLDRDAKADLFVDRAAMVGVDDLEHAFFDRIRRRHADRSLSDAAPLVDVESFLPSNVLAYGDRMSMAHALEVRVPFCDHVVVERLAPVPLAAKMPGGVQKGLFRWAMRDDLPPSVLLHRKVGFNPPLAEWLRHGLRHVLDDYLDEAAVRSRGWFRPDVVAKMRRGMEDATLDVAHTLWSMVVLEAWQRWLDELPRPAALG